jgi:hypothetical protein
MLQERLTDFDVAAAVILDHRSCYFALNMCMDAIYKHSSMTFHISCKRLLTLQITCDFGISRVQLNEI